MVCWGREPTERPDPIATFAQPSSRRMTDDRSHAIYSPALLRWYDVIVLGISNRLIWRCPTPRLLDFFNRHVSGNHLDVGVGTGYFLDRCRFPVEHPRVTLLDANPHCLKAAARRLARYQPQTIRCDITQPIEYQGERFDSISLNYVLHCLPGPLPQKARVLDHLRPLLNPGGVLFGATLLAEGAPRSWAARRLMAAYNRQGIFGNAADSLDDLRVELERRFDEVQLEVVGCAALFTGQA